MCVAVYRIHPRLGPKNQNGMVSFPVFVFMVSEDIIGLNVTLCFSALTDSSGSVGNEIMSLDDLFPAVCNVHIHK